MKKRRDGWHKLQLNLSGDYYPQSRSPEKRDGESGREQAPLPVQQLADKVSELEGAVEEARHAASSAGRASRHPGNLEEAQLALIVVQRNGRASAAWVGELLTQITVIDSERDFKASDLARA